MGPVTDTTVIADHANTGVPMRKLTGAAAIDRLSPGQRSADTALLHSRERLVSREP
jgi:hypothetical protein